MNEAELLFTQLLDCDRLSLYLNKESILKKSKSTLISSALKRRLSGEPIQYILGKTEFMGLDFKVMPDVFIPRPETEILVEKAIKVSQALQVRVKRLRILDIATGCGNIAISIAKSLGDCAVDALDISGPSLEIAQENARLNRVKVNFIESNLFDSPALRPNSYDLILSNPPYIARPEIANLQPEIDYEPRIALDGGEDGLDFYDKIVAEAPNYLKKEGFLIMEIGFQQKKAIEKIFQKSGKFEIIEVVKDYNNIERVIVTKSKIKMQKSKIHLKYQKVFKNF